MKWYLSAFLFSLVAVVGCESIQAWWETPGPSGKTPADDLAEVPAAVAAQDWPKVIAIVAGSGLSLLLIALGIKKVKKPPATPDFPPTPPPPPSEPGNVA